MEKAPSTENGSKPITSNELAKRIEATREELAVTRQQIAKIPKRKTAALGAPVVDEKKLLAIEEDESGLRKKETYLVERLPLLSQQKEEAEAAEAHARLAQLVTESAECSRAYDALLATFHENATRLRDSAEQVVAAFRQLQAAHDEQDFLVARFGLEPAALSSPSESIPHEDDTADSILKPLADFWQRQNSLAARNEWSRWLHELQNERRYEQQQQAPVTIGGHVRRTVA